MVALAKSVPPCDSPARVASMTLERAKAAAANAQA
jgi:hypothetical protein